jgi:hypothetical protein
MLIVFLYLSASSFFQSNDNGKKLRILKRTHNLGTVPSDTIVSAKFYFINVGNETVNIEYINPDCTCTSYFLSSKNVLPSDTAYVEFTLNTKGKAGKQELHSVMKVDTYTQMYDFLLILNVSDN